MRAFLLVALVLPVAYGFPEPGSCPPKPPTVAEFDVQAVITM